MRRTPEERFEEKVDRSGECHRWTGAHHGKGYGHFKLDGKVVKAHIAALRFASVDIPQGMTVDHVWSRGCKFKDCVRIEHLEVVTNRENTLRGSNLCAQNARKTHCQKGHEYNEKNTYVVPSTGSRMCWICIRERNNSRV